MLDIFLQVYSGNMLSMQFYNVDKFIIVDIPTVLPYLSAQHLLEVIALLN